MKAITQSRYGDSDVLDLTEIEQPQIGPDEVLVRVKAAGVDRGVWHLMTGLPYLVRLAGYGVRAPKNPVPGSDVAGVVEAVGSDVTRFRPGDEVFGIAAGAFAELAAAKQDKLAHKPVNLSFEEAAAVPVSGLAALQALRDVAGVEAGQRVLVVGASGGVGSFAVQIAAALGAEVTGVASTAKLDFVRALGARDVIDYTTSDYADTEQPFDVIIDIGGNSSLGRLRRALASHGTLVITGGEGGGRWLGGTDRQLRAMALSPFVGQRLRTFISKERHDDLEVLADLIEAGKVAPAVSDVHPLADAPGVIRGLAAGRVSGKAVLAV